MRHTGNTSAIFVLKVLIDAGCPVDVEYVAKRAGYEEGTCRNALHVLMRMGFATRERDLRIKGHRYMYTATLWRPLA